MKNLKNFGLIGAGAAGAVAVAIGATGVASAQDEDPVLTDPEAAEDAAPDHFGQRRGFRTPQAMIDQLIEDGVITQEQADDAAAVREALHAQRAEMRAEKLQGLADAIGISVDDLQAAKADGQTLSEIAGDNLPAVVDYLTDQATERITQALEDGRITQEQADEKLDGLSERIEERIENGGGFGRRHGHGPRGLGGRDIDPSAEVPQELLDRLAENGVDTDGVATFEDLQALRESGELEGLGRGFRGRGPGAGPGAGNAAAEVSFT